MAALWTAPSVRALSSATPSGSGTSVTGSIPIPTAGRRVTGRDIQNEHDDDDDDGGGGWTDVAIKAAKDFTLSQREKLQREGVLGLSRPISIIGSRPLVVVDDDGSCVGENDRDVRCEEKTISKTITKTIHFQRHGQGYHNLICDMLRERNQPIDFESCDPTLNPMLRMEFLDPPLTHSGILQSKAAAKRRRRHQTHTSSPQLIIVSPLLRCLQTAQHTFGEQYRDDDNDDNDGTRIPWIAHEGCREELGLLVGNKRRCRSEIMADYSHVDFSHVVHDDDVLWDNFEGRKESLLEQSERIYTFLTEFVAQRPEEEIAIVSHSAYLFTMLNAVVDIKDDALKSWFLTSEVRTIQLQFEDSPHVVGPVE
jgi:broad specificity phosphatase PhoE